MLKVGLTGGIGSGKTFVSREFARLGANIVDLDIIAREIVAPREPALERIVEHFGDRVLNANSSLDRQKLRAIIFNDPEQKDWLEKQLHPIIRARAIARMDAPVSTYHLLVSPLLFEADQRGLVDQVVVVDCDESTQIQRTIERDQSNAALVQRIMANQVPRDSRLAQADFVIDNSQTHAHTLSQVQDLHNHFMQNGDPP